MIARGTSRRVSASILVCLAAASVTRTAAAQTARPQAIYTKLYESDSTDTRYPSLSPDGKWIVFTGTGNDDQRNLWIVRASGSGKAERLMTGTANDEAARWMPSSDRIVFVSSRVAGGLMTLQIDRATGKPIGIPQRLTLDKASAFFDVSADGKWVVYSSSVLGGTGPSDLRVIPASGGPARSIAKLDSGALLHPQFTGDGSEVEYVEQRSTTSEFKKVPTKGGAPTVIVPRGGFTKGFLIPARDLLLRAPYPRMGADEIKRVAVMSRSDDTIAIFEPKNVPGRPWSVLRPTYTRGVFLTAGSRQGTDIHVISTDGGAPHVLLANTEVNWPEMWTVDGKRLYYSPDGPGIRSIRADGGDETRVTAPPAPSGMELKAISASGRLLFYWGGNVGDTIRARAIYDTKTQKMHALTPNEYWYRFERLTGPGGGRPANDDVFYTQLNGDAVEIRLWSPDASSRLLRTLPKDIVLHSSIAIHGDRTVYRETAKDSARLMVGVGPTGAPRAIAAVRGRIGHFAFSHDGRTVVATVKMPGSTDSTNALLLVGVGGDGRVQSPARLVSTESSCDEFSWMPDDQSVIALCFPSTAPYTRIVRFPVREGGRPVVITGSEKYSHWDFVLSPDGKQVAYPVEREPGGSIWRVEIPGLSKP